MQRHSIIHRPTPPLPPAVLRPGAAVSPPVGLIWMLGIALCFGGVGLAGISRPVVDVPAASVAASLELPPEVPVQDLSMSDLPEERDEPAADSPPSAEPEPSPEDSPPEPAAAEAPMLEVPPAPEIEPALRVLEPLPARPVEKPAAQPRPEPAPRAKPSPRRTESPPSTAPAPGRAAPGPAKTPGTPGGTGTAGTAKAGRGGRGKFPKPPYPSFAKAAGLTGTVTLSVRVSPDGSATSVSVSGSSGSSQLDSYAASWVQTRWRWPAGEARIFRLPVRFNLR